MNYISHLFCKDKTNSVWEIQSNEDHSKGVADLAKRFADEFGMAEWGHVMGLMHDKGKEQNAFQQHIKKSSGYDPSAIVPSEHSHAYVGGLIVKAQLPNAYPLMGNPIMGHHRGLYDYTELEYEAQKSIPADVAIPQSLGMPALPSWFNRSTLKTQDFHHIERMLYSCLVDADFLDTERFMQPDQFQMRGKGRAMAELLPKLDNYLSGFGTPTSEVNKIRDEIQKACLKESQGEAGFYSLTVPTGGGKTLSSLVWAVNHAIKNKKKRIIIAIPYTSIIVQTASILRRIFGEDNVLEHHSNITIDENKKGELTQQLKLATENWDYPIIVTTNVQLFESMMASRSSDCRKLHNICNSVMILDEVQTLPIDFLQPIVDSLDTYKRLFGVSVLFTTASQPVLKGNHMGSNPQITFSGLENIKELIPADADLHNRLRRVKLEIDNQPSSYDDIAQKLKSHDRVLCIVNTRKDAKEIFDRLPQEGVLIHLSRMMCPEHVSAKIQEMKDALSDPNNKVIRVVSTQLIEAGVDIDFPVVYRQEAGLDSVLQAAGRCNREGKSGICTTYVFSLGAEHPLPKGFMTQCNNARVNMGSNHDWFSPEAMNQYFLQLYSRVQSFDKKDIRHYLYNPKELMMETGSKEFRLIDDATTSVVVNWGDSHKLLEELKHKGPSYSLIKKLSQYSVNLRKFDFDKMLQSGALEEVVDGFFVASAVGQYDDKVGLLMENQWIEETWII